MKPILLIAAIVVVLCWRKVARRYRAARLQCPRSIKVNIVCKDEFAPAMEQARLAMSRWEKLERTNWN